MQFRSPHVSLKTLAILGSTTLGMLTFSGCGMFSSSARDKAVEERTSYRKARPECNGLDLGSGTLSAKTFRALVRCFNSNGSIPELQALVDEASDTDLQPILQLTNEAFLGDPASLQKSRELLNSLDQSGELDAVVKDLGGMLSDPARIRAILEFLDPGQASRRLKIEPADQAAIEKLVLSLTPREGQEFLRLFSVLLQSPATLAMKKGFDRKPITDAEISSLSKTVSVLVKEASTPHGIIPIVTALVDEKKWPKFKAVALPSGEKELLQRSREMAALSKILFSGSSPVTSSCRKLDAIFSKPISCYAGGHVFKKPWNDIVEELKEQRRELPEFFIRFSTLTTLHARSFCQLPSELLTVYPEYLKVFESEGSQILMDLVRASVEDGSFIFLKDALLQNGENLGPMIQVLEDRGVGADALLALSSLDSNGVRFLHEQWKARNADGSFSQYLKWLSRLSVDQWKAHFTLWSGFLVGDLSPYVTGLRRVDALFEHGNEHPWFEGVRKVALMSLQGKVTTNGLGSLAELKNFDRAVGLLHEMSQDGRATPILLGLFNMLSGKSEMSTPPAVSSASAGPARVFGLRHQLHSGAGGGAPRRLALNASLKACLKINLKASIASQAKLYQECEGTNPGLRSWQNVFLDLSKQKTLKGDETLLAMLEREFRFPTDASPVEARELVRSMDLSLKDGSVARSIDAMKLILAGDSRISGLMDGGVGILARLKKQDAELPQELVNLAAKSLNSPEMPGFLRWLRAGVNAPEGFPARTPKTSVEMDRLARWVRNKECESSPSQVEKRLGEIIYDYQNAISGWERGGSSGRSRRSWDEEELIRRAKKVHQRVLDPDVQVALRNMVASYSLLPGQPKTQTRRWTAAEAVRFFEKRSKDPRPLSYIYPGEKETSVRLMSSLDRLEVVLTAANFVFPYVERFRLKTGENFALKFMAMIGEAWGDSPRELWPAAIQRKYPAPQRPMTQREVYLEIKETLDRYAGLGALPRARKCKQVADPRDPPEVQREETWEPKPLIGAPIAFEVKANLYNLLRVLPVIEENLPGSGTPTAGGMLFLRDVFYELYYASEPGARTPKNTQGNQLSLILEMGDIGFLRALTYYFQRVQDPVELAAHSGFVGMAGEIMAKKASLELLQSVLSKNAQASWLWMKTLIHTGLRQPDATLTSFHALVYAGAEGARLGLSKQIMPLLLVLMEKGLSPPTTAVLDLPGARLAEIARGIYSDRREAVHEQASTLVSNFLKSAAERQVVERLIRKSIHDEATRGMLIDLGDEWKALTESSEYRRLNLQKEINGILSFLSGDSRSGAVQASALVRRELSRKLTGPLGRELLGQATTQPKEFQAWMRGVFDALDSDAFADFLGVLGRHLN